MLSYFPSSVASLLFWAYRCRKGGKLCLYSFRHASSMSTFSHSEMRCTTLTWFLATSLTLLSREETTIFPVSGDAATT